MQRFFTIIEGEGRGESKPFTSTLMIVGRAQEAEIHLEDSTNKVSRRHLQVRVDDEVVFVENMSPFGTLLNGKTFNGIVSLESGDILKVGEIKLRYDEKAELPPSPSVSSGGGSMDSKSADPGATKVADSAILAAQEKERQKERDDGAEDTHAVADKETRVMPGNEFGRVKVPQPKEKPATSTTWVGVLLVVVLALVGGTFWFLNRISPAVGTITYADTAYSFLISYPAHWTTLEDRPDYTGFGIGQEGDPGMARLVVVHDKSSTNLITGLNYGFHQYMKGLKEMPQFKGFELAGSQRAKSSDATVIFFDFHSAAMQGEGLFSLNADMRLVVICYCRKEAFDHFRPDFDIIRQSFHLTGDQPQKFIDYGLPEAEMTALASSNPVEFTNQIHLHILAGEDLLNNPLVKLDHLSRAMQEFRHATELSLAGQDWTSWRKAAEGLQLATQQYKKELEDQRFKIKIALKEGDRKSALWLAECMKQMVTDTNDPAYMEAYNMARAIGKGRR
jgi:hypothetical protein